MLPISDLPSNVSYLLAVEEMSLRSELPLPRLVPQYQSALSPQSIILEIIYYIQSGKKYVL